MLNEQIRTTRTTYNFKCKFLAQDLIAKRSLSQVLLKIRGWYICSVSHNTSSPMACDIWEIYCIVNVQNQSQLPILLLVSPRTGIFTRVKGYTSRNPCIYPWNYLKNLAWTFIYFLEEIPLLQSNSGFKLSLCSITHCVVLGKLLVSSEP